MSRVDLFNGATIKIEGTNTSYHTYTNWGLYITNTNCIGNPEQYTKYVEVPGRDGLVDLSEAISGRQVYKKREIKINLAGPKNKTTWASTISTIRNAINGKICQITFDDDTLYYWRGRVEIKDFSSALNLGKFTISIPNADPYKYSVTETTVGPTTISGSGNVTITKGNMPACPNIVVSDKTSTNFTVTYGGVAYNLTVGDNRIPSIMVGGPENVTLAFAGSAKVSVVYRSGSL